MYERFKEFLKAEFDYDVTDFAVYEYDYEKNKVLPVLLVSFGIIFILFIVDLIVGWGIIRWFVLLIAFILLVILPLVFNKSNRYRAIYVTQDYLVEQLDRTEFQAINYDEITSYRNSVDGIVIGDKMRSITLEPSLHRDEVEGIIDILESKGKTFDKEKQYMIRPVIIEIRKNKIRLIEQEVHTELDRVYDRYQNEFLMLTPGYVDEISFRNVNVDNVCIDEEYNNVSFRIDEFEVRDGHPENTTFGTIHAMDGIVIFHQLQIQSLILKNEHDPDATDEKLPLEYDQLAKYLEKSNISEWRVGNNTIDFYFATGVYLLKARFKYKDIIIGWNKTKE